MKKLVIAVLSVLLTGIVLVIPSVSVGQDSPNIIAAEQVNQISENILEICSETLEIANMLINSNEFTFASGVLGACTLFSSHANHLQDILGIRDDVLTIRYYGDETPGVAGPAQRIDAYISDRIPMLTMNIEAVDVTLLNIEVYNKNLALDGKVKAFRREIQGLLQQLETYSVD